MLALIPRLVPPIVADESRETGTVTVVRTKPAAGTSATVSDGKTAIVRPAASLSATSTLPRALIVVADPDLTISKAILPDPSVRDEKARKPDTELFGDTETVSSESPSRRMDVPTDAPIAVPDGSAPGATRTVDPKPT